MRRNTRDRERGAAEQRRRGEAVPVRAWTRSSVGRPAGWAGLCSGRVSSRVLGRVWVDGA